MAKEKAKKSNKSPKVRRDNGIDQEIMRVNSPSMVNTKKSKRKQSLKEKYDMYDMIVSNMVAGGSIIEPTVDLDNSKIAIGFSNIASKTSITKYFVISNFPDWVYPHLLDTIRDRCILPGVKVDFQIHSQPHKIRWDSSEMRNKLSIWKNYVDNNDSQVSVFEYRAKRDVALAKERIIWSTKYLNEAELDYKRTLMKVSIVIIITGKRDDDSIINLGTSVRVLQSLCNMSDIKLREIRVNMMDWVQHISVFSMKNIREIVGKMPKKIFTDDLLANFNSYKQGRVGVRGIPLGIDVLSGVPVMYKFKDDPDAPENILISASTGGGKSLLVKHWLPYLMADGFVVTVMDYEGDEYTPLADFVRAGNSEDVKVISMGKGSEEYCDPVEIADLTGDNDVDDSLKESANFHIMAHFRIMVGGLDGVVSKVEERMVSEAIKRVYNSAGVTDDKSTWHRSKHLKISMVYDELRDMFESKQYIDEATNNSKHLALSNIVDNCATFFEPGEAKYGTFGKPMSINELNKAKLIIFSFGMKGATNNQIDPTILSLKQLSVANISIQISNNCKYVRKCFNVKVWEEYQRWGEAKGSAEIIGNTMTGGRKRGDVNFIITNHLSAILDENNPINAKLKENINSYCIGKIADKKVREKFCDDFGLNELRPVLDIIAKANKAEADGDSKSVGVGSRYRFAFCVILDNGKKAVIKAMLPSEVRKSKLYKTGVDIGG